MNRLYKPIRKADLIIGGTAVKQGEIFTLGFQLFDANGLVIVPTVGQTISVKVANKTGVVFETTAVVVGDHIEFTVDENIGAGKMRVELTVADGADVLQKYPANGYIELYITASLDDIGTGTIYTVTAAEMFTRIEGSEVASAEAVATAGEAVVIAGNAVTTADAVRADFDLVVAEAGSSNPEVVLARGEFATLEGRLDDANQQLADKLNKGQVAVTDINKNLGKLDQTYMSDTFLQQIAGTTPVNAIPADNTLTTVKYVNGSVTKEKLDVKIQDNLFINATNTLVNGNFATANNWIAANGTKAAANNVMTVTGSGASNVVMLYQDVASVIGQKYYFKANVRVTNNAATKITVRVNNVDHNVLTPVMNQWYEKTGIITATATGMSMNINNTYASPAASTGQILEISYALIVNLTAVFGEGKEPTTLQMDKILERFPNKWFSGTDNLLSAKNEFTELLRLDAELARVSGVNNYSTVPTYVNGVLTKVEELDGATVKKRTTFTYNPDGTVNTVSDLLPGETVISTINYVNGEFSSVSKQLIVGGL